MGLKEEFVKLTNEVKEIVSTVKNQANVWKSAVDTQVQRLESWKSSFTANATFNGSTRGGGYATKRIGKIRIDSSADYFDTGLILAGRYVGFSLSANVLYERQDGDSADTSMIGYTTGYIGSERITTSVYGDADIKVKVDADGHILIANTTPPSSDNAYLIYHIEYVTQ